MHWTLLYFYGMNQKINQHIVLVLGASGATGKLLVAELLKRNVQVRAVVRTPEKLSHLQGAANLKIIKGTILDMTESEITECISGCNAIASCLGHNLSFKGIYGKPRKLVTDSLRKLCNHVIRAKMENQVKIVLMNTAGNRNRKIDEPISLAEKCVIGLLRLLLPPHVDNERASQYLQDEIGFGYDYLGWAVVRPDSLIDKDEVTNYMVHVSPIRSALFNAGKTSRINVAHFMADLITVDSVWEKWKGQMPVIYNASLGS